MTGRPLVDIAGRKFGSLTARYPVRKDKSGHYLWHCGCECGATKAIRSNSLLGGRTKSCGCLSADMASHRIRARNLKYNRKGILRYRDSSAVDEFLAS